MRSMDSSDDETPGLPSAASVNWDIRRDGRSWGKEALDRFQLTPEKFEMYRGKLFFSDEERLLTLGLLLENLGADTAVRFGDARIWREAVASLEHK